MAERSWKTIKWAENAHGIDDTLRPLYGNNFRSLRSKVRVDKILAAVVSTRVSSLHALHIRLLIINVLLVILDSPHRLRHDELIPRPRHNEEGHQEEEEPGEDA